MVFGVTDTYKTDIDNIKCFIYWYYYQLVYPVGINIFPIPYWLFPYSLLAILLETDGEKTSDADVLKLRRTKPTLLETKNHVFQ